MREHYKLVEKIWFVFYKDLSLTYFSTPQQSRNNSQQTNRSHNISN